MRRILAVLPLLVILAFPPPAQAGHSVRRTLQFLGFSEDGARYLLKVADADTGDALSVRAFATGRAEATIPLEDKATEKQAIDQARKKYRITDPGQETQQSPDGKYTIMVFPKGLKVEIRVMRGERRALLKALDARPGPDGPPRVVLTSVVWTADGRKMVVVVHRTMRGENGVDADEAHPIQFLPGELKFEGGT
jgi:hypothetical protein